MIFRSFNLLENREKGKRERDDVSPKDDDVSPCDDVGMTSARRPARERGQTEEEIKEKLYMSSD